MFNLFVDLTDNCNLRCRMCGSHDRRRLNECIYFDTDIFKNNFTRSALQNCDYVQIGNCCEPLLHNEFCKILQHARQSYDGTIKVITNGTLLHKYSKEIQKNCSQLTVSIDSLRPDRYANIRGANLNLVLNNLKKLDASKIDIRINTTFSRENIDECSDIINFCKQMGYFPAMIPMSLRQNVNMILLYENCYNTILFSKECAETFSTLDTSPERNNNLLSQDACKLRKKMIYVGVDGYVQMCQKFCIGSIFDKNFEEILSAHNILSPSGGPLQDISCPPYCIVREKCYSGHTKTPQSFLDPVIVNLLEPETLNAISMDSSFSDEQRLRIFLQDISKYMRILHVWRTKSGFESIELTDFTNILHPDVIRQRYQDDEIKIFVPQWADIFSAYPSTINLSDIKGPVVVWGMGGRYKSMKHLFKNITITAFATNDVSQHGTVFEGRPIIGLDDISESGANTICICSHAQVDIQAAILSKYERRFQICILLD